MVVNVLLALSIFYSAFVWLIVLLFTSAVFRGRLLWWLHLQSIVGVRAPMHKASPMLHGLHAGFEPITEQQKPYAGVLIASVAIQEIARIGIWIMHRFVWV